jgi:hypothetical protein
LEQTASLPGKAAMAITFAGQGVGYPFAARIANHPKLQ